MKIPIRNYSLRIAGVYALAASVWIVLSDRLLSFLVGDFTDLVFYQTFKRIFFVVATTLLLFMYARFQLSKLISLQSKQRQNALEALKEKEVLLREVHHRVKNNLQVIVSLLNLKGGAETCASDVRDKVRSMALVHELLYASPDLSAVDASAFAKGLAELMRDSSERAGLYISSESDNFPLNASTAIPIGIFIVEACSNAIQHAWPEYPEKGSMLQVHVSVRLEAGMIIAGVKDNGRGFESEAHDSTKTTLGNLLGGSGTALMDAVASQVNGSILRLNNSGGLIQLRCPYVEIGAES